MNKITIYPTNGDEPYEIEADNFMIINRDVANWELKRDSLASLVIINIENAAAVKIESRS